MLRLPLLHAIGGLLARRSLEPLLGERLLFLAELLLLFELRQLRLVLRIGRRQDAHRADLIAGLHRGLVLRSLARLALGSRGVDLLLHLGDLRADFLLLDRDLLFMPVTAVENF